MSVTGQTRLAAIIGDPVRHSLSPVLYNAAFAAVDLDWVFVAFEVPVGGAVAALAGVRALGIDGLTVTMPHKADVAAAVDELAPSALELGAVNVVVRAGSRLVGHNTDGDGLVEALRVDEGVDPAGLRCLVLGAGGAARSVAQALGQAGAAEVAVVARRDGPARAAAALAGNAGRVGTADDVAAADLVVNATPVGMEGVVGLGEPQLPLDPHRLGPGQVVVDLVYHPLVTPLLTEAKRRGAVAVNGLGMLLHQAGLAFRLWTGQAPPLAEMSAAVLADLARTGPATDRPTD